MLNRLLPLTILLLTAVSVWGQEAQNISIQPGGQLGSNAHAPMACIDQYAGTISFANFNGQSNDIDLDTIYFCFGDQISIVHNGDQNLTGDPNNFTAPGITYGFFDCPPTVSGPNLASVLTDPCLTNNPPPVNNIWVTAGGSFNGNITFSNTGGLQNTFNGGNPLLLWFAPLTIDNFALKQYENDPNTGENGPCVNLNVDEAFAVVYLNDVTFANFSTTPGMSGCSGQVRIRGGLPQFDGSSYNVTVELIGNPDVTGTVNNNPVTHNGFVNFSVPAPGFYNIIVEDGKSCGKTFLADMTGCVSVAQSIQDLTAAPGDNICLNVTNESGFNDIVSMQYAITWDPTILQFTNVTNLTPNLPSFTAANNFNDPNDSLLVLGWSSFSGNGVTLPPGEVLYQICFDVIGTNGECTPVEYVAAPGSVIEVVNENGAVLGFNGIDGEVCVSNTALVVDIVQDSVTCNGGNDGAFSVTVSGGTPPYNVTWQPTGGGPTGGPGVINVDGGTFTAMGLTAGSYSVSISDTEVPPNTVVENVTVLGPPVLAILFSVNPGPCNGDLGAITSTLVLDSTVVVNPLTKYSFLWSNAATTTSISGLTSGFYTLTVTEIATGCTVSDQTFLPQAPPLSVSVTVDSATCSGVSDGQFSVMVSGGTPNANGQYHIEIPNAGSGIDIMGTGTNVMGVISGTYFLTVTDANGCVLQQNIFLPAIKVLSINAQITDLSCGANCDGAISITGNTTGGAAGTPYNFDWFGNPPPPPPSGTTGTTSTITNVCEGTYWVVMEDTEGCEVIDTFVLVEPTPLDVVLINVQNETCSPGMDGSVTVGIDGGTWPFTYTWNIPNTDSTATGLSAGMYSVTVVDVDGCTDSLSATVSVPPPPQILTLPDDNLDCINSTNGSLTATASAGVTNFSWSNGGTGATINNLTAGQYILTVTAANGCTAVDTALVIAPSQVLLDSLVLNSPQCPGQGNGSITAFVSGGTGPYFFSWSNGSSGIGMALIGGATVTAGQYSVTVTDANNCQPPLVVNATLEDPPSIVVDFSAIDSVSCANTGMTCDGTASAAAMYSDGTTGIFDFDWVSGEMTNNAATSTAMLLCQGLQQVTVSDGTCFETFEVLIPAPLPISPGQTLTNVSCNGLADGTITLSPQGGTPPYTINWSNGQTGATITGLAAGNYTAVITDSKNCTFNHTVTIIEPTPLNVFLNPGQTYDISCPDADDGIITVAVEGGNVATGAEVFLWQNGVAPTTSNVATGLAPGTYSVTVVDHKGCEDSLTHTLVEPPPIQFRLGEIVPISCFGTNTFVTVDSVWGGNQATYQFSVNQSILRLPGDLAPIFAGTHTIEVVDVINGCTVDTMITIAQPLEMSVDLPEIVEIDLGDTTTMLDPVIVSSLPIDSFFWSPPDQLSCTDCKNPTVFAIKNQLYTLIIWDINGCSATAQVLVDIDRNRNVYIPNIFSPNGDGLNDKFQVFTGPGVTAINFIKLYDRWGELLFEESALPPAPDGTPGWDGSFRGQDMNPAVFLYLVEVEFLDGQVLLYRGDVSMVR